MNQEWLALLGSWLSPVPLPLPVTATEVQGACS